MPPADLSRHGRALAAGLVLLGSLAAGCGSNPGTATPAAPATADASCRAQWAALANSIASHTPDTREHTHPSALAERWNTVAAGVDYYVTSATTKDCGDTLDNQRVSIDALIDFGNGLQAYDMEYQEEQLVGPAQAYLDGSLPHPSKGKAVSKQAVLLALQTLAGQAATASADLDPGWREANSVDLADHDAVEQTLSDLDLLGAHSTAYQQCRAATAVIQKAISQLIG